MRKLSLLCLGLLLLASADANAKAYKLGYNGGGGSGSPVGPTPIVSCNSNSDCEPGEFCNVATHRCVKSDGAMCKKDDNCPTHYACIKGHCSNEETKCTDNNMLARWDSSNHRSTCYECDSDANCIGNGSKTKCDPLSNMCAECLSNTDCVGMSDIIDPYCNSNRECVPTQCNVAHCSMCQTGQENVCSEDACEEGYVNIDGSCEPCANHTVVEGGVCQGACTKVNDEVTCYPDSVICNEDFYEYDFAKKACAPALCDNDKIFTESYGCVDPCGAVNYNGSNEGGIWSVVGNSCEYAPTSNQYNPYVLPLRDGILDDGLELVDDPIDLNNHVYQQKVLDENSLRYQPSNTMEALID